jgi:hypothetical protein
MAVAVRETISDVDRVAAAVLDTHALRGDSALESQLVEFLDLPSNLGSIRTVTVAGDRVIEIVLDADMEAAALTLGIWRLAGRGWDVRVLVALDRIGRAHPELRGVPCRLQPYWFSADGVDFGGFEIP